MNPARSGGKAKHVLALIILAGILLSIAYLLTTIPFHKPKQVASEIVCQYDSQCPANETCRRELSSTTKQFFGEYKCRTKVPEGKRCETWGNCISSICAQGLCQP